MHRRSYFTYPIWAGISILLIACLFLPLLILLTFFFIPGGEAWASILEYSLPGQISNTILLLCMVVPASIAIGTWLAWLVSVYDFRSRKILEWALILPLTFPTYIMAFTQAQMFSYGGLLSKVSKLAGAEKAWHFDILNLPGLALVLTFSLYPYVYLPVRLAFRAGIGPYLESARMLGKNNNATFFRIAAPLARPAIIGGAFLVAMEVLNDYGAVKYYGISTLTTGIFSAWFSSNDLTSAIRIALFLLIFVLIAIGTERLLRKNKRFISARKQSPPFRESLNGSKRIVYPAVALSLLFIAFILPLYQVITDAFKNLDLINSKQFIEMSINSLLLAFSGAIIVIILSFIVIFGQRINDNKLLNLLSRSFAIGYALPGAVIAVAVMLISSRIDDALGSYLIGGSIAGLLFAFTVRFIAIGYNNLSSGFERQAKNSENAALSLGQSPSKTLFKVNIPISKRILLAAFILAFVDMAKELPLTLILRPFNFHTFSTKAFEYASDEMLAKAALPSLFIILLGALPVILLNRSLRN